MNPLNVAAQSLVTFEGRRGLGRGRADRRGLTERRRGGRRNEGRAGRRVEDAASAAAPAIIRCRPRHRYGRIEARLKQKGTSCARGGRQRLSLEDVPLHDQHRERGAAHPASRCNVQDKHFCRGGRRGFSAKIPLPTRPNMPSLNESANDQSRHPRGVCSAC